MMIKWTPDGKVDVSALKLATISELLITVSDLKEALDECVAALRIYDELLREGWLVRNTKGDHADDWASKQLPYVLKLSVASNALRKIGAEP